MALVHARILARTSASKYAAMAGVGAITPNTPVLMPMNRHRAVITRAGILRSGPDLALAMEIVLQRYITEIAQKCMVLLTATGKRTITTKMLRMCGLRIYGLSGDEVYTVLKSHKKSEASGGDKGDEAEQGREEEPASPAEADQEEHGEENAFGDMEV